MQILTFSGADPTRATAILSLILYQELKGFFKHQFLPLPAHFSLHPLPLKGDPFYEYIICLENQIIETLNQSCDSRARSEDKKTPFQFGIICPLASESEESYRFWGEGENLDC